jgi:outer membrane protein assembly complex protein YaeT
MTKTYPCFLLFAGVWVLGSWQVAAAASDVNDILGRYEVKSIEFNFVNGESYKVKRLLAILSFKEGEKIDAIKADFGREDIEKFYSKNGFSFVRVKLDDRELSRGKVIYTIDEGSRAAVTSVKFQGNVSVKSSSLREVIKTGKKSWFFWSGYYSKEQVATDAGELEDIYAGQGFLDVKVTSKVEFNEEKSKARVTFVISEGPQYSVSRITFKGAEKIFENAPQKDEGFLRGQLKLATGEVYLKRTATADRKRILKLYHENGFVDATVTLNADRVLAGRPVIPGGKAAARGEVNVEFAITEGSQFRIGRIDITGNKETQDKVVRRVLDEYEFHPGALYNKDLARGDGTGELERKISRMAYTKETTITALPLPPGYEANQRNVEVNIKEGQTGSIMFGAGVGSDSGVVGQIIFDQRNFDIGAWPANFGELFSGRAFKGAGQSLRIALQPGTEVSEHYISFTEPYFQDQPIAFQTIGSSYERFRESYEESRLKGYFGFDERFEKRYSGQWRKGIGFRAENVDVGSIDSDAPKEIFDIKGNNFLTGVKLNVGKDSTDDDFYPTSGDHLSTSYEQVTGDAMFGILGAAYNRYWTLYEDLAERKTVLATRVQAETIFGDAPAFEKFYAGGMSSLRGFDYRGVSTRGYRTNNGAPLAGAEQKDPIGSDWLFLTSSEVIVPLVGETLSWLVFLDSGTVDTGRYRVSAGAGIQILIPQWFGPVPMRFAYGVPLMKDDSDETRGFIFFVGRLF